MARLAHASSYFDGTLASMPNGDVHNKVTLFAASDLACRQRMSVAYATNWKTRSPPFPKHEKLASCPLFLTKHHTKLLFIIKHAYDTIELAI
jgi:hypothetical protein